jgi:hypothetical protein
MIKSIRLWLAMLRKPRRLKLTQEQAEYVRDLFIGGSSPEDLGRAMDRRYKRTSFPFFMIPNEAGDGLEFGSGDYEIDGLEYLNAALWHPAIGAVEKKGRDYYYVSSHPMVQRISKAASEAPIPQSRRG